MQKSRTTRDWGGSAVNVLAVIIVLGAVAFVLGLVMVGVRSCSSIDFEAERARMEAAEARAKDRRARIDAESREEQYGSESRAWIAAQEFVKQRLVSPGTADFGDQNHEDNVLDLGKVNLGNGRYRVSGWVDSQNGFGATLRSHFFCTLKYVGDDQWQLEDCRIYGR